MSDNKKKKGIIITLIVLAVCGISIAIVGLTGNKKSNGMGAGPNGGPGGFPGGFPGAMSTSQNVVSVKTQLASVNTLKDYVNTYGEIQTQSSIDVFPSVSGKVTEVTVSLGSSVEKGDILAYIDQSEPGSEYAKSPIIAPISGTITQSPLKPGSKVSVSSVFTVIGDVANLQVIINVPERYVSSLKQGLKAEIILEAYPNEVFYATATKVSPVVDSSSRTKEVILNFDSNDNRINAGMFAKVKLYTEDYTGYVTADENCIVEKNNKKYVYVVNDDNTTVSQVEVTTGKTVDNQIQITSGVEVGQKIVIEGMRVLSNGATIKEINKGGE